MPHRLLSPDQYERVVSSTVSWARSTLQQLDLVDEACDRARSAASSALDKRAHKLVTSDGVPTSALAGCVAVRIPDGRQDRTSFETAMRRLAAWEVNATPVLLHAATLRRALKENLHEAVSPPRQGLFRRERPQHRAHAVDRLEELRDWAEKTGYSETLRALVEQGPRLREDVTPGVALSLDLAVPQGASPVLPSDDAAALKRVLARGTDLIQTRVRLAEDVRSTFASVRERMVKRQLEKLPVTAIKDAMRGGVRVSALEDAGVRNVQQVLDRGMAIASISGISAQGATQVVATARQLRRAANDDLRLRIDLDEGDELLTRLVSSLHTLLDFEERLDKHRDEVEELISLLSPLSSLPAGVGDVLLLHPASPRRGPDLTRHLQARAGWVSESGIGALLGEAAPRAAAGASAWEDFKRRAAEYYGLLGELVGITADVGAAQGHLPLEVVEAVDQQQLDTSRLKASLRGYQEFGARYALVQRRVLVGDEMGLGKTVQALAVMAHLSANGAQRFLVVCPSAVLINWMKEIRKHSHLEPVRIHGAGRDQEWRRWRHRGGVAVTSFDTLYRLPTDGDGVDLLVVDEAHFVKNPSTKRAEAVTDYIARSDRTMMLTGTPLENRVDEFRNLVSYLQPEVSERLDAAEMVLGAHKFREAVAPVYLRRNSDDVLTELPDLVETEEWLRLTDTERDAYLDALLEKGFQQMRQVAFTADRTQSSKLERLEDIVEEASANGLKVVVFSYFLDVLDAIGARLGNLVVGTISGSTSPDKRQALADEFTAVSAPAVLLSQIVAGGVGMNLQAASVVILCEPQVKPSLEDQAIKRAHRMGQVRSVQVHRLLTEDTVDERMLQLLQGKSKIFAEYAAQSAVAEASPSAVAVTEAKVAKEVLAQEQERYAKELRARQASAGPVSGGPPDNPVVPEVNEVMSRGAETGVNAQYDQINVDREDMLDTGSASRQVPRAVAPARPHRDDVIHKCNSCNRPYDSNGHCGCS